MNVYFGVFSRRRTRQIDFTVRALRQFRERQPHDPGEGTTCCPAPKSIANMNTSNVGRLGLSDAEEDALVLFMQTLTDGFMHYSRLDGPAVVCLVHLRAETRLKPCSVVLRPTISAKKRTARLSSAVGTNPRLEVGQRMSALPGYLRHQPCSTIREPFCLVAEHSSVMSMVFVSSHFRK
jgi:hypothetical protein